MTNESQVLLNVKCPECGIKKEINVPGTIFETKQFGTFKIQIPKGSVCIDHQFLIYVDKKGIVRSYETSDLYLSTEKKPEVKQTLSSISDFVKMIGKSATLNVLHAILLDTTIYIVQPVADENSENVINATLYSLLPEFCKNNCRLRIISRSEFLKIDRNENILAIDQKGFILICPWIIESFQVEEEFLDKILKLNEYEQQQIVFRQLFSNLYRKINFVGELILKQDVTSVSKIKSMLKKKFLQKRVSDYEMQLMKDILTNRFNLDTSKIN